MTLGPVRTVCLLEPCHYKGMWSVWSISVKGQNDLINFQWLFWLKFFKKVWSEKKSQREGVSWGTLNFISTSGILTRSKTDYREDESSQ